MKDTDLRNDSKTGEYKPVNGTTYYANTGITKGSAYAQEAVSCLLPHPSFTLSFLTPSSFETTELRKQQQHHHYKHLLQHLHPDFPPHHRLRGLPLAILPLPKYR